MKRKIFILIPLIIFAKQNFAQFANPYKINYNYYYTFDSTYDTFFGSTVHSIYPYTVVKSYTNINGDSVYEFSKTVTSDNSECMKIIKPSILGKTFTILDSGRFLITTFSNDTIYFRTTDTIGSTWNCYRNDTLNLIIDAKIEKRELQEVCGELDTVITFKFKVYDKNKKPIQSHFLNFCRVQLSYNHGFIETFSLRSFPNFESYYNSPSLHIFKLTGIANSNLSDNKGITSFYRHELYNYDVGDEIQEYHAFANRATSYSYGDSYHYYLIKKVIDKIIKNDTVKYKIEEHVWSHSSKISTEGLESQIVDTLTNAINTLLIRIDYNNIYTPSLLQEYSGAIEYFDDNKSYRYSDYSTLIKRNDTCYGTNDDPYSYNHQSFAYTGIGGYYYYSSYSGQFMQSKLLYVKKGNKILGTPYPFALGINDKAEESLIKVYPNPANNILHIETANKYLDFELFDFWGNQVLKEGNKSEIDISTIDNGIYYYKISNNDVGFYFTDKLIIQH